MDFKDLKDDIKKSIDDGTIANKISELAEKSAQLGAEGLSKGLDILNETLDSNLAGSAKGNVPIDGKCPNCSAPLELTYGKTVCTCRYCGTQIDVVTGKNTIDKVATFVGLQAQKFQEAEKEKQERERQFKKELANRPFHKKPAFLFIVLLLVVFCSISILFFQIDSQRKATDAKLEALVVEVQDAITAGEYDAALIKANMIKDDSTFSFQGSDKWDQTREALIELINEKKAEN